MMYAWFYQQSSVLHLPIAALIIFMCVFLGVVVRVLRTPGKNEQQTRMASLPLQDEPLATRGIIGGSHD
ncbi:MAG: cbb3-type cytochrome c oxidase subunit 3 [Myxococcota bacterium]